MIGYSPTRRTTDADAGLLDCQIGDDGKKWVYVQASGAIDQYDYVTIDEDGQATAGAKAGVDDAHKIGVAAAAFADDEYGWVQVYGPTTVNVKASASADAALYTSATAGHLDSTATTAQTKINGIVLTTAGTGSDNETAAFMAVEPFTDL